MSHEIDFGDSNKRLEHKLRYQDSLYHAVALDTNSTVYYKGKESSDKTLTPQYLTKLKAIGREVFRRNYIQAGATKEEAETIINYGKMMDTPTELLADIPLIIKRQL